MKITLIREEKESGKETVSTCEADALLEKIKTETKAAHVTALRTMLLYTTPDARGHYEHIDKLPRIYPSIEYGRSRDGSRKMKRYNGVAMLEVNDLAGLPEVELVKEQARLLPQTWAAITGSSGRSVKIWVKFVLPDGSLPVKEENITLFHACAYRMAVQCYQPILPFPITLKEPSPTQSCRMTLDVTPYFNPDAIPFCQEQPFSMPGEQTFHQRKLMEKNPLLRLKPGFETSETFTILFETALGRALDEMENWKRGDALHPLLVCLTEHCFKAGIPEEETVRQVMIHYYRQADEQIVRTTIHNLYRECKGFGKKSALTPEQEISLRLEEFMERRYEFRFNTVSNDLEFRQKDSIHFYFQPVDQRARNSISMDALQEGIKVWDRDVNRYLASNRVPLYNPVEDYLCSVGRWDGKDRIHALADLVPCNNPHWRQLFYRWFLNMVAHWRGLNKQYANSTSPLLVGSQGFRKSTYCRIILPPELRFGYTDSLDFGSKRDAEMYLGRFMLINIDEFDQVSMNQQGFLKHLLQKPVANLRKPYGSSIQEIRRYASFIGTSNQKDLLTDPSGSRRFICIEVTAPINTNVTINYRQLYAQAMDAITKGERYWFDDTDEAVLKESNREFEQISPLEQLFHCYFRSPEEGEMGEWMTSMEIIEYLQGKSKTISLSNSCISTFGRILKKNQIESKRTKRGMQYEVIMLNK
ncbi:MAG: DUF3874 domain-containing protein [Bacteroides sp.]|uniref:BT4734/BF3469 family protein n=1 Tax=Bacteroides sp. TaxID=29523 RepID=UPI0025C4E85C|nr:BT4734/BF3469 family protein [Bacteroides sp.]MBS6237349.1 DUF3874 domain-containing protein [Bacteroides sp.]